MNNKIGIMGGDLRIIRLAEILAKEKNIVHIYGLEKKKFLNDYILVSNSVEELCKNCDYIISGIPFSKNEEDIDAPFSERIIKIEETFNQLNDKTLITGAVGEKILKIAIKNNIKIIDLMKSESFTVLNVIPTIEGALQVAMQNTEFTIHDSKCLVLGFGRIGKLLCSKLNALGANVSCMARENRNLSWIKAMGYKDIAINDLNSNLNDYDIIFNTIPAIVLKDEELKTIKRESSSAIIIELASSPGGVDIQIAKKYDIKIIKAQGLPGKVAPLTAAKYIKQTIDKILN